MDELQVLIGWFKRLDKSILIASHSTKPFVRSLREYERFIGGEETSM